MDDGYFVIFLEVNIVLLECYPLLFIVAVL